MFALIYNGSVFDFWGNHKGDVFIDNTCSMLNLDRSLVDLVWYPITKKPSNFQISEEKVLSILETAKSEQMIETVDGNGDPVWTLQEIEETSVVSTHNPDVHMVSGVVLKVC